MIRFAVIGTSKISREFITTALTFPNFALEAIYSRDLNKGLVFGKEFSCSKIYNHLDILGRDTRIDAVYIASPNAFHCPHAIELMKYGKHILCEKPLASNSKEVEQMIQTAKDNRVLLMEAMKTPFMPVIQNVRNNLSRIGKIRRAFFNYSQYSSRYDNFRKGIIENAFKLELSNGALVDIGIYPLFAMLYFFGNKCHISAKAQFLHTGVDGLGTISLKYDDFIGDVHYSKITNSLLQSEIQGEEGNILIEMISEGLSAKLKMRTGEIVDLGNESRDSFYYETEHFLNLIESGKLKSDVMTHKMSLDLMKLLDKVRLEIGLVYEADKSFMEHGN